MTGGHNRSAFYDRLRQALAQARRTPSRLDVALFDLDGLMHVHDTYGHPAGDLFIRSYAERLSQRVRETDTVARLGGDEFGVLFPLSGDLPADLHLGRQWADEVEGPVAIGTLNSRFEGVPTSGSTKTNGSERHAAPGQTSPSFFRILIACVPSFPTPN